MECRDRASPRKRGDLGAFAPEEFERYAITPEDALPLPPADDPKANYLV